MPPIFFPFFHFVVFAIVTNPWLCARTLECVYYVYECNSWLSIYRWLSERQSNRLGFTKRQMINRKFVTIYFGFFCCVCPVEMNFKNIAGNTKWSIQMRSIRAPFKVIWWANNYVLLAIEIRLCSNVMSISQFNSPPNEVQLAPANDYLLKFISVTARHQEIRINEDL